MHTSGPDVGLPNAVVGPSGCGVGPSGCGVGPSGRGVRAEHVLARLQHLRRGSLLGGQVELFGVPPGRVAGGVFGYTGHAAVFADLPTDAIRGQLDRDDVLMAATSARFVRWLGQALGVPDDGLDVLLAAPGLAGAPEVEPVPVAVARSGVLRGASYRSDVRLYRCPERAVELCLGYGFGGRTEVSVHVPADRRGAGLGRWAARQCRLLVPDGMVYAQIAPANAASLRAFLAAGFTPVGSEILFWGS